jgi:prophage tail gpP-like protein
MAVFTLEIGSREFIDLEHLRITKGLQSMANAFIIRTGNMSMGDPTGWDFKMGDSCKIYINDTLLMTGVIDNFDMQYSPITCSVTFQGRDGVCDLIDSSFDSPTNEWRNQTLRSIVNYLCNPFDIDVAVATDAAAYVTRVIPSFKADEGDFVSDIILRLCKDNGILPISLGDGKLTLTRAVPTVAAIDSIQLGQNVVVGNCIQCNIDRYSSYKVKGMGQGAETKRLTDFIEPSGSATDSIITRTKPLVLFADGPVDNGICQTRARWEANIRAGNSRRYFYTLPGVTQSEGSLWDINMLVNVQDTIMDIDTLMLIDTVEYVRAPAPVGEFVVIGVVDRRTYQANNQASQIKGRFD